MARKKKEPKLPPKSKVKSSVKSDVFKIQGIKSLPLGNNYTVTNDGANGTLRINKDIAKRLIARGYGQYIVQG